MFGGQQCNGRGDCECGVCQCRTPEFVKASDDPSDTRYNVTGSDTPGLVILVQSKTFVCQYYFT